MRQDQIKYASERIVAVRDAKLEEAKKACTVNPTTLSDKEKLQAIRDGEVSLRSTAKITMSLDEAFLWRGVSKFPVLDNDAYQKASAPIRKAASEALDQLMLGSEKDAMRLINAFIGGK